MAHCEGKPFQDLRIVEDSMFSELVEIAQTKAEWFCLAETVA
jgi:hypothetical protein